VSAERRDPKSRRWLLTAAAVGVGAGVAAGVGLGWGGKGEQPAGAADNDAGPWSLDFETPAGGARLSMAALRGRPLLLNFWATWCPPCVREMPALDRFYREHRNKQWQVLGIAADNAAAVREFLARAPVAFPIALAGFEGIALSARLGNASGGLPFTVVYGKDGRVRHRHAGETRYDQLVAWAQGIS
jgi:thiol-disulfide isomerase/thioredoxin